MNVESEADHRNPARSPLNGLSEARVLWIVSARVVEPPEVGRRDGQGDDQKPRIRLPAVGSGEKGTVRQAAKRSRLQIFVKRLSCSLSA